MQKQIQGILIGAAVAVGFSGFAGVADAGEMVYKAGDRSSGYTYATKATQAIQDDDLANPAYLWVDEGEDLWNKVDGKAGKSCANCHVDNPGNMIRANLLTEGQSNGFPTYRLKWQKLGSIHRRFRGCNKQVRAKPYGYGSDEYVNLELYVAWRGRGLSVETPAVRN